MRKYFIAGAIALGLVVLAVPLLALGLTLVVANRHES